MTHFSTLEAPGMIMVLAPIDAGRIKTEAFWVLSGPPSDGGVLSEKDRDALTDAQKRRTAAYMADSREAAVKAAPDAARYVVYSGGKPVAWLTLGGDVMVPEWKRNAQERRDTAMAETALKAVDARIIARFSEDG